MIKPDHSADLARLRWFTRYVADQITHVGRPTLTMPMIIDSVDDHLFELEESTRDVVLGQAFVAGRLAGLGIRSYGFERVGNLLEPMTRSVIYSMVAFEVVCNGYLLEGIEFHRAPRLLQTA